MGPARATQTEAGRRKGRTVKWQSTDEMENAGSIQRATLTSHLFKLKLRRVCERECRRAV